MLCLYALCLCALCSVRLSVPCRSVPSAVCWCSALCRLGIRVNIVSFRAVWRYVGPVFTRFFVCTHVQRGLFTPVTFEACLASARREISEYGFLCARENYHYIYYRYFLTLLQVTQRSIITFQLGVMMKCYGNILLQDAKKQGVYYELTTS